MLPPEIISALIYSGPGSWSWIDAAAMWQELSLELEQSLSGYTAELSSLAAGWQGPSYLAMTQAAQPYLEWLDVTAQQCQQVAAALQTVTAAFEFTHFTVVPPPVVAANRTRLAVLVATNFLGINAPAIAETEAEYNAMWVTDAAAMTQYQATSTAATAQLTQFSAPMTVANPNGVNEQSDAVSQAAAQGTGNTAGTIGDALNGLNDSGGLPDTGWFKYWSVWGWQFLAGGFPINLLSYLAQFSSAQSLSAVGGDIGAGLAEGTAALSSMETSLISAIGSAGSLAPNGSLGVAVTVGKLMSPPAVVGLLPGATQPAVQLASAVSPLPSGATPPPALPIAPMRPPQGGARGRRRNGRYDDIEVGAELPGTVMQRPPSAG